MSILTVRVGWDYDDVLFPWYDLAHAANIAAGTALPEHEPTSWAPHEDYGITLEERHTPRLKAIWACRCGSPRCTGTMLKPKRRPAGSAS